MSDSGHPDEDILVAFLQALERAAGPAARAGVLARFSAAHPRLAPAFREAMEMDDRVGTAAPGVEGARLPAGTLLGPFRIVRLLAVGGMGELYEAEQAGLGRRVALKAIRRERLSPLAAARFAREQRLLARLHHTHVVPVFASGVDGGLQYFAMQFINGITLGQLVRAFRGGHLPLSASSLRAAVAASAPPAPGTPGGRPAPTRESWFRAVAGLVLQAADALHHAHRTGVLHRDVKPGNLMVDSAGQCWVVDFGLAGLLAAPAPAGPPAEGGAEPDPAITQGGGLLGTPAYMAPEQHRGAADVRSDVWGLGATLHEVLTLRRAFDGETADAIRAAVLDPAPAPLPELDRGVPTDLAAVCRKALRKDPDARYQTAQELADDLRRYLDWKPTAAHPDRWVRPAWLALRRNWSWVTPLAAAVVTAVLLLVGQVVQADERRRVSERITLDTERREELLKQELKLQQVQSLRLTPHALGWRTRALSLIGETPDLPRERVQEQAAAVLCRLDGKRTKHMEGFSGGGVAFDPAGERLAIAGVDDTRGGVYVFAKGDETADQFLPAAASKGEWVAFRPDGTLVRVQPPTAERRAFRVAADRAKDVDLPLPEGVPASSVTAAAVSADGSTFVAGLKEVVLVWETATGTLARQFKKAASVVAVSPDGRWVAAGDRFDPIAVLSVATGEKAGEIPRGRSEVRCLAFGRSPRHDPDRKVGWLVAAGYAGSDVAVWDADEMVPVFAGGSAGMRDGFDPAAVAFSPDGTTFAIAGAGAARLHDTFTGQFLLELTDDPGRNGTTGVAFSPSGRQVAVSSPARHRFPGGVTLFELESGRGTLELRGLSTPVARCTFSPDGKRFAAYAHDWQVGVWEAGSGRLLHLWKGPHGPYQTDLDLHFNADGSKLAAASGREAVLWDVASGKREQPPWVLPPGLQDAIAFGPAGQLVLVRTEMTRPTDFPDPAAHPPAINPRVIRVRDLLSKTPLVPLQEITDIDWRADDIRISPDGKQAAAKGQAGADGKDFRMITFDPLRPGRVVRVMDDRGSHCTEIAYDPTGEFLAYNRNDRPGLYLLNAHTGERPEFLPSERQFSPGAHVTQLAAVDYWGRMELSLHTRDPLRTLFRMASDTPVYKVLFSPDERRLAWTHSDGVVTVADLPALQRALAEYGLGW